jgi:ADP-heptose:LPS heptosyltransferase
MNRKLLLLLDKTVLRALFYAIVLIARLRRAGPSPPVVRLTDAPRFLVIRPGGLGDGLMSLPFLRALKQNFPAGHVTLICVKKNQAALKRVPFYDELIVLDDLAKFWRNVRRTLRGGFDVLFDLEPFRRTSAIVAWASGTETRVGFDTNSRRLLYTHLVTYAGDSRFEAANMLYQLRVIGLDPAAEDAADLCLPFPDERRAGVTSLLSEAGIDAERVFLVAVAVGALKPHHRWVMTEFARLIELVRSEDRAVRVVLVGSPTDVADTEEVWRHLGSHERVTNLVGKTDFNSALGVLERCRILISCDGGLVYMGAAMGCSTLSLWGPGVMERFKPPGERHVGVRKNYACIPCVTWERLGEFPPCPYERRCYNDLTAEEVFGAYRSLKGKLMASGLRGESVA